MTISMENNAPKKIKLVLSDCHLSGGKWLPDGRRNPLEDFHQDERFREFLDFYSSGIYQDADVELIINGDFFDPLALMTNNADFPKEVQEHGAVEQFQRIVAGHPVAMRAMKAFLSRGKKIVFRWGNHDAAILWPKVQAVLIAALAPPSPEQLSFQVKPYVFDRVCVDHGHQYETLNQFDEENIFIERKTKDGVRKILNLPFGSFFVLGFLNRLKVQKRHINQVFPFSVYLKVTLFIEPLFVIINGFRVAWFFIKTRFITHPMRFSRFRKTLLLLTEVLHRPSLEEEAEKILTGPGSENLLFDTLIMGHNHQAQMRVFANGKQYINTGTWIPITSLDMSTLGHRILRTYALIEYIDGKARASLKIWNGLPTITDDFA